MEKLRELVLNANKSLRNADHMLYMTYPLVKDVKLLISIVDNIDKSIKSGINAVLRFEWLDDKLYEIPDDFKKKLELFKKIGISKYGFDVYDLEFAEEINDIINKHRQSPVEFIRSNKFVISYENYKLKIVEFEDVKKYVWKAKTFIGKLNNIMKDGKNITSGRR